jgi:hypothetical protein
MSDKHDSVTRDILVKLERCWAAGDINAQGAGHFIAGGLVGFAKSVEISESWAGGDVNAQTMGNTSSVYAGGLAGELGAGRASIDNCYALGNVLVNKNATVGSQNYYTCAGGLAGHATNIGSIGHSFTAGSVTAQSSFTAANSDVFAGGVVGLKREGTGATLSHTAALGAKIVAANVNNNKYNVGRVYDDNQTGSVTANYALNSMLTGTGTYDAYIPGSIPTANIGKTAMNGASVGLGEVRTRTFWEYTLDFNASIWDFSYLVGRGYPQLSWQQDFTGPAPCCIYPSTPSPVRARLSGGE